MTASLLNLNALQATPLQQNPYPYLVIENFIDPAYQQAISETFPTIQKEGSFPLSAFQLNGAMADLIQALDSDALRQAIALKFSMDLDHRPTTITLRGVCTLARDGKIHTDSKDKLITVLLYLGADPVDNPSDGCLRILYNNHDLNHFAAQISPAFGHCVMFKVTPHGWHGFKPVQGQRRAIQLNYVVSTRAATKNIWRHQLAAFLSALVVRAFNFMRVLLVKLTSMGDLIHALPAITDASRAIPGIRFDWVIDENFAQVASWHPAVNVIIKSAHRRWRKNYSKHWLEIKTFVKQLRSTRYDLVIDGQTNLKAALVTVFSKGIKCGFDKASAREYPAHWVYQRTFAHDKKAHAVLRLRSLFAQALNYDLPTTPADFGIDRTLLVKPAIPVPTNYLLFIHNASWTTKLWPESYWQQLIEIATANDLSILLPAGNDEELARSQRLAQINARVTALPHLSLSEIAYLLAHAKAAVAVDTGLSHLSAALHIPTVTLYGATDADLIGATGLNQIHLQSRFGCAPCYLQQCNYLGQSTVKPACFEELSPALVWQTLQKLLP